MRWPYAEAVTSPIHERDLAAVAVRALREDGHAGAKYALTGPQSLTQREQVSALGDALGRRLHFEEIAPETARLEMSSFMPPFIADMLLKAFRASLGPAGMLHAAPVTPKVEELTGAPARSFRQWALDHAADFQPNLA